MAGVLEAIKSAGSKVSDGIGSLAGNLPKAILFVREYQKDLLWSQGNLDAVRVQAEEDSVLVSLFEGEDAFAENVEYHVNDWKQKAASNAMSSTNMYMNNLQQALEGGDALSGNGTTAYA
ncbi:hypothetical protein RCJ22_09215, partial [Vibrio sp. FNV 38]|nr:hypothetical protein [Vibrio sp. FNV 38]